MVLRSRWSSADGKQSGHDLFRRADFEQWGLSEGCPWYRHLRTGQEQQQARSEACRRRIEALLRGNSSGSAGLAAADERINRALADAVERHATKDPGTRGISEGRPVSSVIPSRSPRRKLHWTQTITCRHTLQSVSSGGSLGTGARPSETASNDPNTVTGVVTGEERTGEDPPRTRLEQAARMTWVAMSR